MSESVDYEKVYEYDTLQSGITVIVTISYGAESRQIRAKIDTGAENCIFERKHGERLGVEIESGREQIFSTAAGIFVAYGHELTLSVLDIETVSTVYFAKEESFTRNVLGRIGFLDRVKLGLIDYEGRLFLSAFSK
jgi:predicted aspartyl protease